MKKAFLSFIAVFILVCANAQYKSPSQRNQKTSGGSNFMDRIYFGGGGGFSGGSNYLNVSVSPLVGYKITDKFSAGLQITYQYVKSGDLKFNNYGGGPFLRYNVTEKFFTYTQYEYLNFGYSYLGNTERETFNSWFVGLGYSEPITKNIAFNITALYNVLYSDGSNSPYSSPFVFRVGIVGGLF